MKVLVFLGSRSNYGRLHQLILGLQTRYEVSICLACTAVDLQLPEYIRSCVVQKIRANMLEDTVGGMATTTSLVAMHVNNHLLNNYYDFGICHGDRFETLGFATACSFANVPLVHMEAGEYSGNIDDKIRWAITALASLHLAPTLNAAANLRGRTVPVFVGSPAVEYILRNKPRFVKRVHKRYVLVVYNPTDSKELNILVDFLDMLRDEDVHWVNPNVDPGNKAINRKIHKFAESRPNVKFLKNLPMDDYLTELSNCRFLVGNTSSGIKEAAALEKMYFMFPNRQIDRELDKNVIVCKTLEDIAKAYNNFLDNLYYFKYEGLFGETNVTDKCLDAIEKYIGR